LHLQFTIILCCQTCVQAFSNLSQNMQLKTNYDPFSCATDRTRRVIKHFYAYPVQREICALLWYNAASSANPLPTFRDNVSRVKKSSVPSSSVKKSSWTSWPLIRCPETSVKNYHSTLRNTPASPASRRKPEVSTQRVWNCCVMGRSSPSASFISTLWEGFRLNMALNQAVTVVIQNCFWSHKRLPYAAHKTHLYRV
jgi:hypothetical protein